MPKLSKSDLDKLEKGECVHCGGMMLVPLGHNPHEARDDGFHPAHIGAKKAPDGRWYVEHGGKKGKYLRVVHG